MSQSRAKRLEQLVRESIPEHYRKRIGQLLQEELKQELGAEDIEEARRLKRLAQEHEEPKQGRYESHG